MSSGLLLSHFYGMPWAIHEESYFVVEAILKQWLAHAPINDATVDLIMKAQAERSARKAAAVTAGGGTIAVLPLYGILMQRGDVQNISGPGMTSLQQFSSDFQDYADDTTVATILIDIDSPGGSVAGVPELVDQIRACVKPVIAISNAMAASAAYWIGSAADELYCTPSGQVGSIGIIACHIDRSKSLELQGIKPTLISAGRYKVEGNSFGPLDDDALAYSQGQADAVYRQFAASVAKGRNVPINSVRDGMGQGRMLLAQDAMGEKMIDGIMSFPDLVKKVMTHTKSTTTMVTQSRRNSAVNRLSLIK
jgi:signal peptide peptidase SppA